MDAIERYPMQLEDESDSDAETFIVPTPSATRTGSNTIKIIPAKGASLDHDQTEKGTERKSGGNMSKTEDIMKKSVLKPGFEQLDAVPRGGSRAMQKRKNRLERTKTSGEGWFNMKAPEMTDEVRQNLEVLQMRGAIDKNRVYKKNDMRTLPKYFAMGTVVEHATDFYSSRIPKKQRKKTLVEELMADVQSKKQLKKQATKLAVKKQLKAQSQFTKKKKPFKKRARDMD